MVPSSSGFVGRTREYAQVRRWIRKPAVVTLVGGAGVGKSRLASEIAARWKGDTVRVDLAHVRDAEGIAAALGRSLGVRGATRERVAHALRERHEPLLVMDDADVVVESLAPLLASWAETVGALRVLTTSRERLRLRNEWVLELGPLSTEGGAASEAGRLFRTRLHRSAPHATLSDGDVQEWIEWLEGVPLAIELAACRALTLREGASQLDVLRDGYRDGSERHATLERAIAWSWSLLGDEAQCALAELSAFASAFDFASATRVIAASQPMEALRQLVEKSFVRSLDDGRFRLFDAVREFAAGRAPETFARAQERLEVHLVECAKQDGDEGLGDDVLAACGRAEEGRTHLDDPSLAWLFVYAARVLRARGPAEQLRSSMDFALRSIADLHVDMETRLRIGLAEAHRTLGDADAAERAAAPMEHAALPAELRALLLTELALADHVRGRLDAAAARYEQALARAPSRRQEGRLRANLGAIAHDRGELDDAEASYRAALSALRVTGDGRLLGATRANLALVYQERGELELAAEAFERAIDDLREGERLLAAIHTSNFGQLRLEQGDAAGALAMHRNALPELRRIGDVRSVVLCLCRRAAASALLVEPSLAEDDLEEAASLVHGRGDGLLEQVVEVHRAFPLLARAMRATPAERARPLQRVYEQLARMDEQAEWRASDDARSARRVLEKEAGRMRPDANTGLADDALVLLIEARFFRPPRGEWQDLRRQTAARRILEHLAERQGKGPSTMADLQHAAWPGERIKKDAAANRIHVALSKLRKRGMKAHLVRDEAGYAIRADVRILRHPAMTPPEPTETGVQSR